MFAGLGFGGPLDFDSSRRLAVRRPVEVAAGFFLSPSLVPSPPGSASRCGGRRIDPFATRHIARLRLRSDGWRRCHPLQGNVGLAESVREDGGDSVFHDDRRLGLVHRRLSAKNQNQVILRNGDACAGSGQLRATVTRKKVAGIEVASGFGLLF